jgi:hypothetical protein
MAISNIGKNFGGRERKSPDRTPNQPAGEKKDTSVFRGKPYVTRQEIRNWLRRDEAYKIVPRSREGRAKLEKELFGSESGKYGSYIERSKKEPEHLLRDVESGKVKPPAGLTKEQTKNLLKKLSGQ